ncbi:hypothetical protein G7046_g3945 [Stylonectria norvegica]|nr:hypothetical protein G7046_g3945 [Stylonectria norvegica]
MRRASSLQIAENTELAILLAGNALDVVLAHNIKAHIPPENNDASDVWLAKIVPNEDGEMSFVAPLDDEAVIIELAHDEPQV